MYPVTHRQFIVNKSYPSVKMQKLGPGAVAYACNPSCLGRGDWENPIQSISWVWWCAPVVPAVQEITALGKKCKTLPKK
jgi:hypothetical protein